MIGFRKSVIVLALALGVALVTSASFMPTAGAAVRSVELHLATELAVSPTGHSTVRRLIQDPRTGRWMPLESTSLADAELQLLLPDGGPAAQQPVLQELGILRSDRWPGGGLGENGRVTITFDKVGDIRNPQRNRFRRLARLVTRNTGHRGVPRTTASNQRNRRVRPPSAFEGGALEASRQFRRNGRNDLGLDEDNILFFGHISNPHDPEEDPVIRSIRFSSGTCTTTGGRFFCPFFLEEGDIFFRARETIMQRGEEVTLQGFWEDLDRATRRELMAAMIKFIHGHMSDAWSHSVEGGNRREVDAQAINRTNSRTWRELRDGDALLYGNVDPEENGPRGNPTMRPRRNSVIDVDDLEPPMPRENDTPFQALFGHRQFVETNLLGFNRRRQIGVEFYEGRNTNNANRFLQLAGFAVNRAITLSDGSPGEAAYRASHLFITDPDDWETLRDRVVDNGRQDARANGIGWDRILVVNVCISGHVRDGGGARRMICQPYRYAYDIPPDMEP